MRSFRRLTIWTLVAVYVLILVGGIVRSTGSGMGCPDWPRCFGNWVPPSSVNELPENYKEEYAAYRHEKNKKFARYLSLMGMDETAEAILNDKSILVEADFNPVKTWIEYGNRIVGVTIGFLIIAVFISSLKFRKVFPSLTWAAFATLILVIFQGWIGSFVVSTNLTPWTVTVHMLLAFVIIALLAYLIDETSDSEKINSPIGKWWLFTCITVLLVQTLLGTQLREAVDVAALKFTRDNWLAETGDVFVKHRSFSWIVLILHIGLIVNLKKTRGLKAFPLTLILLILGTILTGVGLAYLSMPAVLQPVHLLLATVTFGMQFLLLLKLKRKEKALGA
ncbi:MAG TPA: COX15/CtaA family protein [Chryseosolibacter sp.]|nr:COX15/CtaA family protein [Chryseosolibacter sp.]